MTRLRADDRAVSIAITHALTLGITALLIASLLFGAGSMLRDQEERAIRSGLHDVSDSVANEMTYIDRLAASNASSDVVSVVDYPNRIGGGSYSIELSNTSRGHAILHVNSTNPDMSVPTVVDTDSDVCEAYQNGGTLRIYYDADRDCLTIGGISP
jgi:hypothetical protein